MNGLIEADILRNQVLSISDKETFPARKPSSLSSVHGQHLRDPWRHQARVGMTSAVAKARSTQPPASENEPGTRGMQARFTALPSFLRCANNDAKPGTR